MAMAFFVSPRDNRGRRHYPPNGALKASSGSSMPKPTGIAPTLAGVAAWLAVVVVAGQPVSAADFRIEGGLGVVHSDHDLSFTERLGPIQVVGQSGSALGGAGFIGSAAAWVDGVLIENMSIGVEYLRTGTDGDLTLGASAAGQNFTLGADLSLDIDTLFLNFAWRRNAGREHPYAGLGLGVSRLEGRIDVDAAASFVGTGPTTFIRVDEDEIAPSGQAFFGFDYDITDRFYIGGLARFFIIDGRVFESDEVIRELSAQVKFGIRF
jgi:hypothetical protein